jgi:superfamily II DNA/RNA helicase
MICYDEADEIFLQEGNHVSINALNEHVKKLNIKPQRVLFSATFTEEIIEQINKFFDVLYPFRV